MLDAVRNREEMQAPEEGSGEIVHVKSKRGKADERERAVGRGGAILELELSGIDGFQAI